MAFTNDLFNAMLSAAGSTAATVSLHTADPGTTGANEVAGGSYSRQPITWDPPSAGSLGSAAAVTFDVPASTTVTHIGLWNGSFLGGIALSSPESYSDAGVYQLTTATITAANP